jgi:glycosyltransferase involved in cell wall biosynthesis
MSDSGDDSKACGTGLRLAVVATHPIQYHAPWFRHVASRSGLEPRVFYLWDFGVANRMDRGFLTDVRWDIPLLDGYEYEFVPNTSRDPGTHHFSGLRNPSLMERVRGWEPDAVVMQGYNFASMMAFLVRWDRRAAPLILRGDSHRLAGAGGRLRGAMIRMVLSRFDAFLAVGKANADYLRMHGARNERVFFSPHAVENERFAAAGKDEGEGFRRSQGISESERVVLFAGKLEPKKCPLDLLKAFAEAKLKDAVLVLVGSGELEAPLHTAAAGMRNVRFAGFQNQSRMPAIYRASDVIVLPSAGQYETWGLCINEAMACGVPAIVSSHVGCGPDLVLAGETGWVFEAGNTTALRDALIDALSEPSRLNQYGANARRRVCSVYNYERATEGLLEALRSVGD